MTFPSDSQFGGNDAISFSERTEVERGGKLPHAMFVYTRAKSGQVQLLGEADTNNPDLAVEAVVGKVMLEVAAMGAETDEVLAALLKSELIATQGTR